MLNVRPVLLDKEYIRKEHITPRNGVNPLFDIVKSETASLGLPGLLFSPVFFLIGRVEGPIAGRKMLCMTKSVTVIGLFFTVGVLATYQI